MAENTEKVEIKELAQTQILGMDDIKQTTTTSIEDLDARRDSAQLTEEPLEQQEYTRDSTEKTVVQSISTNVQSKQDREEALALGLQPPLGADSVSKGPQYTDEPSVSAFAQAPPDVNPSIIPDNVGGARISGSRAISNFRAAISPKGLGGDFKSFG